jgi:hypothetical protein
MSLKVVNSYGLWAVLPTQSPQIHTAETLESLSLHRVHFLFGLVEVCDGDLDKTERFIALKVNYVGSQISSRVVKMSLDLEVCVITVFLTV